MTIKELKEQYPNVADIEVYKCNGKVKKLHGDFISQVEYFVSHVEYPSEEAPVVHWELLNEEDYNNTILANTGITADFEDLYGDKNAEVLAIVLGDYTKYVVWECYAEGEVRKCDSVNDVIQCEYSCGGDPYREPHYFGDKADAESFLEKFRVDVRKCKSFAGISYYAVDYAVLEEVECDPEGEEISCEWLDENYPEWPSEEDE